MAVLTRICCLKYLRYVNIVQTFVRVYCFTFAVLRILKIFNGFNLTCFARGTYESHALNSYDD